MKIDDIDKEFQELADSLKSGEEAYQRGDFQQAETLFEQSYEIIKAFGEHPDADNCISKLADVYYQRHKFEQATQLLLDLYQIRAKQMSTRHPSFVSLLFRTAKCYERQGLFLEAEYVYLQCLGLLNVTGMPDRNAAANIAESFAKMLRGIEGRQEEADELEEQARDLRNMTREKLNLEIIKAMDFEGVDIVDIGDVAEGTRTGIRGLRRRAGGGELEPKPGTSKKVLIGVATLLLVVAGAGAFVAWKVHKDAEEKKKKAAAAHQGPVVIKPKSQTFKTVDGMEQLILFDNDDGTFVQAAETIKGKYSVANGALHLKIKGVKKDMIFPADPNGYTDDNGVEMYKEGAPEWGVVAAMRQIYKGARESFHAGGGYLAQIPTYQNPITGKTEAPVMSNIGSMDRKVNFEKMERFQNQVQQVITWSNWSTGRPGCVEIYHYASGDDGDTLYVKGTDATGRYLQSSAPQQAFLMTLVNGDPK